MQTFKYCIQHQTLKDVRISRRVNKNNNNFTVQVNEGSKCLSVNTHVTDVPLLEVINLARVIDELNMVFVVFNLNRNYPIDSFWSIGSIHPAHPTCMLNCFVVPVLQR